MFVTIATLSLRHASRHRPNARMVGEIRLLPKPGGYHEAEMVGRYEGLLKLAGGGLLTTVGCGGRI